MFQVSVWIIPNFFKFVVVDVKIHRQLAVILNLQTETILEINRIFSRMPCKPALKQTASVR